MLTGNNLNSGPVSKIYRNFYTTSNTAPAAPTGLSATSNETSIILKWNRVQGDATPAKGMSYNVRIGTSPGASNVVSPMALSSGSRKISLMGNAQSDTLFVLKYPKKRANYYWSVQAIDNGFASGDFAAEQIV